MSDSTVARLGSSHLEDLAIVALTARIVTSPPAYPQLGDADRSRLRARLKQFSRFDWPASREDDPLIRRGYTLRQCLRLIVVLLLADAGFPPSEAVPIARVNEFAFLRAMLPAMLRVAETSQRRTEHDLVAVTLRGEVTALIAASAWEAAEPQRIRLVPRSELGALWSTGADGPAPGCYLPIDVAAAGNAAWYWLSERDLVPEEAITALLERISDDADGVKGGKGRHVK